MQAERGISEPPKECDDTRYCIIQRILYITRTVKHNYILPISTVRIQLFTDSFLVGGVHGLWWCVQLSANNIGERCPILFADS